MESQKFTMGITEITMGNINYNGNNINYNGITEITMGITEIVMGITEITINRCNKLKDNLVILTCQGIYGQHFIDRFPMAQHIFLTRYIRVRRHMCNHSYPDK